MRQSVKVWSFMILILIIWVILLIGKQNVVDSSCKFFDRKLVVSSEIVFMEDIVDLLLVKRNSFNLWEENWELLQVKGTVTILVSNFQPILSDLFDGRDSKLLRRGLFIQVFHNFSHLLGAKLLFLSLFKRHFFWFFFLSFCLSVEFIESLYFSNDTLHRCFLRVEKELCINVNVCNFLRDWGLEFRHSIPQGYFRIFHGIDQWIWVRVRANRRGDNNDILLAFEDLLKVKKPSMIWNKDNSLSQSWFYCCLLNLTEGLSHNGDKHVHEHNSDDECSKQEHSHCGLCVRSLGVKLTVEVTECTQQISGHKSISDWAWVVFPKVRGLACLNCFFGIRVSGAIFDSFVQVILDDIKVVSESQDDDNDHSHERNRVWESLHNELDKVCQGWKETHPIEHLDPHKEACERSIGSKLSQVEVKSVFCHDAGCANSQEYSIENDGYCVNPVPNITKVVYWVRE